MLAAVFLAAFFLGAPVSAQEQGAMVRVGHLSSDAPGVDVYVNDEPVDELTGVSYKTVSSYLPLPAGTQNVKIYAAGDTSEPILEADVDLQDGATYTVGVVGLVEDGSLAAQVYEDDGSLPAGDDARLRVIHAASDVASVDIPSPEGEPLFTALGFPNATSYEEVPAGTYTLEVNAAGTDLSTFTIPDATLSGGVVYSAFIVGHAEDETLEVLVAQDAGASSGGGAASLGVIPGNLPTASLLETGGPSPMLLFSGMVLVVTGLFFAVYFRKVF